MRIRSGARSATPPDPHASRRINRVAPPLSPRADNSDSGAIATYAASATRRRWRARRQHHVNRRSDIKRFRTSADEAVPTSRHAKRRQTNQNSKLREQHLVGGDTIARDAATRDASTVDEAIERGDLGIAQSLTSDLQGCPSPTSRDTRYPRSFGGYRLVFRQIFLNSARWWHAFPAPETVR